MSSTRRRLFVWPYELEAAGVLGINHRNLSFIQESNPRALYPRVDNKIVTKGICHANGIPVPETYAVIRRYGDVWRFPKLIGDRSELLIRRQRKYIIDRQAEVCDCFGRFLRSVFRIG